MPETDAARERQAVFDTLLAIAGEAPSSEPGALPSLADFLAETARRDAVERDGSADGVVLSTIHRAKGLEWDAVLVPAFEEGFLPHAAAAKSPAGEEEERRLAYVAVTRARRHLVLSWAARRRIGRAGREAAPRAVPVPRPARRSASGQLPAPRRHPSSGRFAGGPGPVPAA